MTGPALLLAACVASAAPEYPELLALFDYDRARPPEVRTSASEARAEGLLEELSFPAPGGGRVSATLVRPSGNGPFPAILYQHDDSGDRRSFLPEALLAARLGAAALLVDAPPAREGESRRTWDATHPDRDREVLIQGVVDLRRALDLLGARKDIDPRRIAFVGHGRGAQLGGILAGVDTRAGSYVLMGGAGASQVEALPALDPLRYVGKAAPAALSFQFATGDRGFPRRAAEAFFAAASEPRRIAWYDGGHELADPRALADRLDFLAARLGLPSPGPLLAGQVNLSARAPVAPPPPGPYEVRKSLAYKTVAGKPLLLDVYLPAGRPSRERTPLVVLIPGDADAATLRDAREWGVFVAHARSLVARGLAAAVVDHRSSEGQTRLALPASDVDDAVAWLRGHAGELGLDDDRLALWAFSGGPPFAFRSTLLGSPLYVKALVSYYGLLKLAAPPASARPGPRPAAADHSPADLLARGLRPLPPMLIARMGRDDPSIDASVDAFLAAARTRKAAVTVLEHATGRHGFDILDDDPRSREVIQATYEFLNTSLTAVPARR